MIINIQLFYKRFSKRNITSVQAPILGKKILLVDKSDVLYRVTSQIGDCCSMIWTCRQGQWKGKNSCISFLEEAAKKLCIVLQCIFELDFLCPFTTKVLGIENYPSPSMSYCSDELAHYVATVLRYLKSVVRKYISLRINFCLYLSTIPRYSFDWLYGYYYRTFKTWTLVTPSCEYSRVRLIYQQH